MQRQRYGLGSHLPDQALLCRLDHRLTSTAIAPFEETFGENEDGLSCTVVGIVNYDREERTLHAVGLRILSVSSGPTAFFDLS